jgi:hypothetical protein
MTSFRTLALVLVSVGLLISQTLQAQSTNDDVIWPGFGVGLKVGTLGLGADLALPIVSERLNLRVSRNYLNFSYDGTADDIDYDFTLEFNHLMLLADWHPFGNNFRLSAGPVWSGNSKVKLKGTPTDYVTIGDHEYSPDSVGTLNGELVFESGAPYVGLGFGNSIGPYDQSWSFVFDLGVILQTFDTTLSANGSAASSPEFQADLKKEQDDLQEDLDQFKIYPVLQFGVAYHF